MTIGHSSRRLLIALVVPFVLLAACSSSDGDDVPDDQRLQPASAPSGWKSTQLDLVTVAAPPTWTKGESTTPEKGISVTTWRTEPVGGRSSAGMEVRQIAKPKYSAKDAAQGLAVNAMATMKGGKPAPEQITWPRATDAWAFTNEITAGPTPDTTETYVSNTFVADLADGSQLQVLIFTLKGEDDDLGSQVMSTLSLKDADK